MNAVETTVLEAVTPTAERMALEIVAVEYRKIRDAMNLTVFIHKKGGVTIDDCEAFHMAIDPLLDELDPTGGRSYVLNVSSPGLDRPFRSQRDFERNYGEEVEVKLFAPLRGKKLCEGVLLERDEHVLTLGTPEGNLKIENNRIALVRPLVKFE